MPSTAHREESKASALVEVDTTSSGTEAPLLLPRRKGIAIVTVAAFAAGAMLGVFLAGRPVPSFQQETADRGGTFPPTATTIATTSTTAPRTADDPLVVATAAGPLTWVRHTTLPEAYLPDVGPDEWAPRPSLVAGPAGPTFLGGEMLWTADQEWNWWEIPLEAAVIEAIDLAGDGPAQPRQRLDLIGSPGAPVLLLSTEWATDVPVEPAGDLAHPPYLWRSFDGERWEELRFSIPPPPNLTGVVWSLTTLDEHTTAGPAGTLISAGYRAEIAWSEVIDTAGRDAWASPLTTSLPMDVSVGVEDSASGFRELGRLVVDGRVEGDRMVIEVTEPETDALLHVVEGDAGLLDRYSSYGENSQAQLAALARRLTWGTTIEHMAWVVPPALADPEPVAMPWNPNAEAQVLPLPNGFLAFIDTWNEPADTSVGTAWVWDGGEWSEAAFPPIAWTEAWAVTEDRLMAIDGSTSPGLWATEDGETWWAVESELDRRTRWRLAGGEAGWVAAGSGTGFWGQWGPIDPVIWFSPDGQAWDRMPAEEIFRIDDLGEDRAFFIDDVLVAGRTIVVTGVAARPGAARPDDGLVDPVPLFWTATR